jgi:hypothetical protein
MGNIVSSKNTIRSGYIYSMAIKNTSSPYRLDECLIEDFIHLPSYNEYQNYQVLILTGERRGYRKWILGKYLIQGRPCDIELKKWYKIDELRYHCKKIESLK